MSVVKDAAACAESSCLKNITVLQISQFCKAEGRRVLEHEDEIFGFHVQVEVFNLSLINTIHYDILSSTQHLSADATIKKVSLKERTSSTT